MNLFNWGGGGERRKNKMTKEVKNKEQNKKEDMENKLILINY